MTSGATRRGVLAAGGAALIATDAAHADGFSVGEIDAALSRYIGFGVKHAGGQGDESCGAWLESSVRDAGFTVARQIFDAPFFTPQDCALVVGETRIPLLAQAPVVTAPELSGPIVVQSPGVSAPARGAIVVASLPFRRWSTALAPEITAAVEVAARDGAIALVLVTNGPTGEAIALNVDVHTAWPLPVAVLAPKDAAPVFAAAARRARATIVLQGRTGVHPAWNLVATLDRGKGRRVVVSTPRSGWTICAGERGGGVAAWLTLAKWAPRALRNNDLTVVCTET